MIISQFSIREVYASGEEFFMNSHDIREVVSSMKQIFTDVTTGLIALRMGRSAKAICAIVVSLEIRVPFIFLRDHEDPSSVGASWLYDGKELTKVHRDDDHQMVGTVEMTELCYFIRTSGTTDMAKLIGVPYSCIEPNIEDFRERFSISSNDVILCSTSLFFDPSIVDIFLSFISACQLLLVPDSARSQPHLLSNILMKYKPSFIQLTPSVLALLDDHTLSWIFGDCSPIRCLLLGGETFPSHLIRRFRTPKNPTKVYNVYGLTEVSCWASVYEVPFNCKRVGIGSTVRCTTLSLTQDNELLIGGTRKCFINGVLSDGFVTTGDIVDVVGSDYYIAGRKDDQVKFNGIRCNLSHLSDLIAKLDGVSFAQFLIYKEKFLVLFVSTNLPVEIGLSGIIPDSFIPSKVVYLDTIPVNVNGKVDRIELMALLEKQCFQVLNSKASMLSLLKKFGIKDATSLCYSFVDFGIRSPEAAEIALHLGHVEALKDILSPSMSIANIFEKYEVGMRNANVDHAPLGFDLTIDVPVSVEIQPTVKWAYNTGKCIDGTPLHTKLNVDAIVVSSHSGLIVCLRVQDGHCLWKANFPCRFEASPELCGRYVCVGGFDGNVYFLLADNGYYEWCHHTSDVVKAPCAVDKDNFAYIPSYDRYLYKLDPQHRKCCWRRSIQNGSPAKVILWEDAVFVTTVNGYVEALEKIDGVRLWIYQTTAPVFSSVTIFGQMCFICSVDGMITKLRNIDGEKQICSNVREPIFSSVLLVNSSLYVVSQNGSLFILNHSLVLLRHFRFSNCSFVVAANSFNSYFFSLVSSCGLFVLFSEKSCKAWGFRLGAGQVFSRVVISHENSCLFAGCRDDWVRCFELPKLPR